MFHRVLATSLNTYVKAGHLDVSYITCSLLNSLITKIHPLRRVKSIINAIITMLQWTLTSCSTNIADNGVVENMLSTLIHQHQPRYAGRDISLIYVVWWSFVFTNLQKGDCGYIHVTFGGRRVINVTWEVILVGFIILSVGLVSKAGRE